MGGVVTFVDPIPTPDFQPAQAKPQGLPAGTIPPPPNGARRDIAGEVAAYAEKAPTPLDTMKYGMTRLLDEATVEATAMHNGKLKNGALQKFMLAMGLANNAAKYMHSTKIDATLQGGSHEDELSRILGIAQGETQ